MMKNYPYGVINGDSDVIIDELLAQGVKYDLVLTDPPYNINKDFGNKSDCLPLDEFLAVTEKRVNKLRDILSPQGSLVWFGIHDYIGFIQVIMYKAGLNYRRLNIWHYENGFSRSKKEPHRYIPWPLRGLVRPGYLTSPGLHQDVFTL